MIEVQRLGKRYLRGGQQQAISDLRERVVGWISRPFRGRSADPDRDFWALRDVSFTVERGEVLGVIGRNGAGKSTLLKILSRITRPTEGRAHLNGRVGSLLEVGTGFHPELTGRENVYFSGAILGMKEAEIRSQFDRIVDFSGVEAFMDTPVKYYSSGMRVRLGFAVAAHLKPEILLVDEVLAVGDAAFQKKCLGKMQDAAAGGRTVVLVSHSMNAIKRLCNRALLISSGRMIVQGEPDAVVDQYLLQARGLGRGEATFPGREGEPFNISRVSVTDGGGRVLTGPMEVEERICVEAEFRLERELPGGYAVMTLRNRSGEVVMMSDNRDSRESAGMTAAGVHRIRIEMPAPMLVPGTYSVSMALCRPPKGSLFRRDDAVSFELADTGGIRSGRVGYIYVPLKWRSL